MCHRAATVLYHWSGCSIILSRAANCRCCTEYKPKPVKKLSVQLLHQPLTRDSFEDKLDEKLSKTPDADSAEEKFAYLKNAT